MDAKFVGTKKDFLAYIDSIGTPKLDREANVEQLLERITELEAERDYWRETAFVNLMRNQNPVDES